MSLPSHPNRQREGSGGSGEKCEDRGVGAEGEDFTAEPGTTPTEERAPGAQVLAEVAGRDCEAGDLKQQRALDGCGGSGVAGTGLQRGRREDAHRELTQDQEQIERRMGLRRDGMGAVGGGEWLDASRSGEITCGGRGEGGIRCVGDESCNDGLRRLGRRVALIGAVSTRATRMAAFGQP